MKIKIKEEYILQSIADSWIVVNTDAKSVNFNKLLSLNESAHFLWERLSDGIEMRELARQLAEEYELESGMALSDCEAFVAELDDLGCIEHDE